MNQCSLEKWLILETREVKYIFQPLLHVAITFWTCIFFYTSNTTIEKLFIFERDDLIFFKRTYLLYAWSHIFINKILGCCPKSQWDITRKYSLPHWENLMSLCNVPSILGTIVVEKGKFSTCWETDNFFFLFFKLIYF